MQGGGAVRYCIHTKCYKHTIGQPLPVRWKKRDYPDLHIKLRGGPGTRRLTANQYLSVGGDPETLKERGLPIQRFN